jgi:predicted aldo/keto reductase-like oxidoreductase
MSPFLACPVAAFGKPVCRLGLALRGDSALTADDLLHAVGRGVNFLNWPGLADYDAGPDALTEAGAGPGAPRAGGGPAAVAARGPRRESVVLCVQFGARTVEDAATELRSLLRALHTDSVDVLTLYYVEDPGEWQELAAPNGVLDYLLSAKKDGLVRRVGVTSHQRPLAARLAASGRLDVLMIRYNAAHRGAEREIFPVTDLRPVPVIAYTATRWGALMRPTPDDPPGFVVPRAPAWYRFALQSPSVAVVLAAPANRAELDEDLEVLAAPGPLSAETYERLADHGARVRRHAGNFP